MKEIRLYPTDQFSNGFGVEEGDKFVARIDSVEGHKRVTLVRL